MSKTRKRFGIADLDGRVAPAVELIYERGTPAFRGQWLDIERRLVLARPRTDAGDWEAPYLSLERDRAVRGEGNHPAGAAEATVEANVLQDNPAGRLRSMDAAGVEVQLIHPEGSIDACTELPSNLAVGMLGAYNRYVTTYCEADPERLKSVLQVHGGEPQWSAGEILELADDPSVAAVTVFLPFKVVPDSPNFAPIWEALEETGLPLVFRPSVATRAWTPQRLISYLLLSGLLDRFPAVRLAFSGSGADWLGPWLRTGREADVAASARELLERRRVYVLLDSNGDAGGQARPPQDLDDACLLWGSGFPVAHGPAGEIEVPELNGAQRERILGSNPSAFLERHS